MIEAIVIALGVSFIVMPCLIGHNSYWTSWKVGNLIALILIAFVVIALVIVISVFHLIGDGISLTDAYHKIING